MKVNTKSLEQLIKTALSQMSATMNCKLRIYTVILRMVSDTVTTMNTGGSCYLNTGGVNLFQHPGMCQTPLKYIRQLSIIVLHVVVAFLGYICVQSSHTGVKRSLSHTLSQSKPDYFRLKRVPTFIFLSFSSEQQNLFDSREREI